MKPWIEQYLNHLDEVVGREPEFHRISPEAEFPPISVITYRDDPMETTQVSFTAGLSTYSHPMWKLARPELCISVRSSDVRWGLAIGDIAFKLKGDCPFCYGDTIRFGTKISEESEMSAFVVFAPSCISRDEAEVQLPEWKISLVQMYPIYEGEIDLIAKQGLKPFFQRSGSFFENPLRPDLSKL